MLDWTTVRDRVPAAATLEQSAIEDLVADAQAFLEAQIGRYLGLPVATTEYLSGLNSYELYLRDAVQTGTPTVTERLGPTATPTAVTGFEQRPGPRATVLLRTDGFIWRQFAEYAVTYTRGFPVDTGPADLRRLALDLITLGLSTQDLAGIQSGSIGRFSFSVAPSRVDLGQIPGAEATLRAWRRPVMA